MKMFLRNVIRDHKAELYICLLFRDLRPYQHSRGHIALFNLEMVEENPV